MKFKKQSKDGITYAKKITKEECKINWKESSINIVNKARAFYPKPCLFSVIDGCRIKLGSIKILNKKDFFSKPGTIISIPQDKKQENLLKVSCGVGTVGIGKLQKAGGNWVDAKTFFNGFKIKNIKKFDN
jgi:methionyl-tRNA formyltransferase